MSTQTEHYQLSLREGTDIFNPMSTNDNFEKIDELLFQGASGGLVTGTPVVSGGTLSFQGLTLVAADTVVKFKLDASHSVNQVTFAGSTIAIVDLSGNNKTLSGGFWIGYVDTNSKFRVIAWPDVVNAQTFEGQPASYYATKTGLDNVNETAANALSTATAATTVANQALEAAGKAGGFTKTLVWRNPNWTEGSATLPATFSSQDVTLTNMPSTIKAFIVVYSSNKVITSGEPFYCPCASILLPYTSVSQNFFSNGFNNNTINSRQFTYNSPVSATFSNGAEGSGTASNGACVPLALYALS